MAKVFYLFDFAETIATLKPSRLELLDSFLKAYNLSSTQEQIRRAYWEVDEQFIYSSIDIRSSQARKDFYLSYNKKLLQLLGVHEPELEQGLYDYHSGSSRHWELHEDVLSSFRDIKKNGGSIGILSNFDKILNDVLSQLGVQEYLDYTWISALVGFEKPDSRFYSSFLKYYEINPEVCIYLGDSVVRDYYPAKAVGMDSVVLDNGITNYSEDIKTVKSIREFCQMTIKR